ncbi:MAG: serine hydrolase domain-containing protein [Actinomycetota bacterium]
MRTPAVATSIAVTALLLAACGDDTDDTADTPSDATVTTTAPGPTSTSPSGVAVEGGELEIVDDELDADTSTALATAAMESFAAASTPGAVIGVRTPEGTWVSTIGSADIEGSAPITADIHQRIGSITKTFTVTALLQLAEAGELSLDDPIGDYIEGTPSPDATLRQLAQMQSGIPSYTLDDAFQEILFTQPDTVWTPEELVGLVADNDPDFAPGEELFYSNTNTVLLGQVIEQVTGQPIQEVLQQQIIEPLGLTGTLFPTDSSIPDPHPRGYTTQGQDDALPADATDWDPSWGFTAGAMISTLDDLLTYSEALATGDGLLGAELQAERIDSTVTDVPPNTPQRSYGIGIGSQQGWYGHSGELPGFNTFMQHHLDSGITVIVMTNSDIRSGECPPDLGVLPDGRTTGPCKDPAIFIGDALTAAMGLPFAVS